MKFNVHSMHRRKALKFIGTAAGTGLISATTAAETNPRARKNPKSQGRTSGRLDLLGHELPEGDNPRYTFGTTSPDGMWGGVSSFPRGGNDYGSTLYDLADLENPKEAHRLESPAGTRSNHIRFDGIRDGLYYRSLEADNDEGLMGIQVVDFGWEEGSPDDPKILATVETPNTGVHSHAAHPEEPIIYVVDGAGSKPGTIPIDVSNPRDPELQEPVGPNGDNHAVEVDPVRDVLHCAYIGGDFEGYAILDLDDPLNPTELSRVNYDEYPDYTAVGTPGFENCHQALPDPNRDLAIVGDELFGDLPGGKHIFDIGWGEGSLENPKPISHFYSPDARRQDEGRDVWTTHFHDIVPKGDETLLVDGGYMQGTWVANITDPLNPVPTERFATDLELERAEDHWPEAPPYCWSAVYNEERDFAFASDTLTGAYTFEVSALPARGKDGHGPGNFFDEDEILDRFR